jgi:hypothetical protein
MISALGPAILLSRRSDAMRSGLKVGVISTGDMVLLTDCAFS